MADFSIEVTGIDKLEEKFNHIKSDLSGGALVSGMQKAVNLVLRDAKQGAPVFTGALKSSIIGEVRTNGMSQFNTVEGIVGSNLRYAAAAENGSIPHFPPVSALQQWAERHGANAFVIARAISRKGTKGSHFLQNSVDKNRDAVIDIIDKTVGEIVNQ